MICCKPPFSLSRDGCFAGFISKTGLNRDYSLHSTLTTTLHLVSVDVPKLCLSCTFSPFLATHSCLLTCGCPALSWLSRTFMAVPHFHTFRPFHGCPVLSVPHFHALSKVSLAPTGPEPDDRRKHGWVDPDSPAAEALRKQSVVRREIAAEEHCASGEEKGKAVGDTNARWSGTGSAARATRPRARAPPPGNQYRVDKTCRPSASDRHADKPPLGPRSPARRDQPHITPARPE